MNLNIDGIEEGEYREITPTERKNWTRCFPPEDTTETGGTAWKQQLSYK